MQEIMVGGVRVPYRVRGAGRPLVLVHGTNSGSRMWEGVAGLLETANTVVLVDLSGSDAVQDGGIELTVELLTEQLAAVITDLGQGPADVVAHSMGAAVAAALAATRPDLVRRLVLVAGFAGQGDEHLRNAFLVWRALAHDGDAFARLAGVLAFSPAYMNSLDHEMAERIATAYRPEPGRLRQMDLNLRLDVRALLPRVQAATLVIGCAFDGVAPVENSRELAAAIAGATYAELDCGHMVTVERPEEFVKLVGDFVN